MRKYGRKISERGENEGTIIEGVCGEGENKTKYHRFVHFGTSSERGLLVQTKLMLEETPGILNLFFKKIC